MILYYLLFLQVLLLFNALSKFVGSQMVHRPKVSCTLQTRALVHTPRTNSAKKDLFGAEVEKYIQYYILIIFDPGTKLHVITILETLQRTRLIMDELNQNSQEREHYTGRVNQSIDVEK